MSVKYSVATKINPRDAEAPPKYYPSIKSNGRITLRQLSKRIAQMSTVSTVDTLAVLEALLTIIPEELANGRIVALGDLGSFWLRLKTTGSESAEQVTAANISRAMSRFTPGKEFKQVLNTIQFEKESAA